MRLTPEINSSTVRLNLRRNVDLSLNANRLSYIARAVGSQVLYCEASFSADCKEGSISRVQCIMFNLKPLYRMFPKPKSPDFSTEGSLVCVLHLLVAKLKTFDPMLEGIVAR